MKIIRNITIAVGIVVLGLQGAQGTQVDWSATGAAAVQVDNSPVPDNGLISIGFFDVADSLLQANQTSLAYLESHFTAFDSAAVGDGVGDIVGLWATSSGSIADPTSIFDNKRIYLWVFNSPTSGAATQYGIFSSNDAAWLFPDDDAVTDSTVIDLAQVNNVVVGAVGPTVNILGQDFSSFQLAVIPEPSAVMLTGLGLLGFLGLRRRS